MTETDGDSQHPDANKIKATIAFKDLDQFKHDVEIIDGVREVTFGLVDVQIIMRSGRGPDVPPTHGPVHYLIEKYSGT